MMIYRSTGAASLRRQPDASRPHQSVHGTRRPFSPGALAATCAPLCMSWLCMSHTRSSASLARNFLRTRAAAPLRRGACTAAGTPGGEPRGPAPPSGGRRRPRREEDGRVARARRRPRKDRGHAVLSPRLDEGGRAVAPAIESDGIAHALGREEKASDEKARARRTDAERGAAPGVGECLQAIADELERCEGAAAAQALQHLRIEQRLDFVLDLGVEPSARLLDEGETARGELAEALQTVLGRRRARGARGEEAREEREGEGEKSRRAHAPIVQWAWCCRRSTGTC